MESKSSADPDALTRMAAIKAVRDLSVRFDDLIPLKELRKGFVDRGQPFPYADFTSGIFRPARFAGPAALSLLTAAPKAGRRPPYADDLAAADGGITYLFREAQTDTARARQMADADNRTLIEAFERRVPLIYFVGVLPGQYQALAPVFVSRVNEQARCVELEAGLPVLDVESPGTTSGPELRAYATREAKFRLHQGRFRMLVLSAYRDRCAVCSLKETALLHAAHIVPDSHQLGEPVVVNGVSLCAIHHLAYDRNLMGIDPEGVVHIATRLLHEVDGPMLKNGLQGFHGKLLLLPHDQANRPDPNRLQIRFTEFEMVSGG